MSFFLVLVRIFIRFERLKLFFLFRVVEFGLVNGVIISIVFVEGFFGEETKDGEVKFFEF